MNTYNTCVECGGNCRRPYLVCSKAACRKRAAEAVDAMRSLRDAQARNRKNWRDDMHRGQDSERDRKLYGCW